MQRWQEVEAEVNDIPPKQPEETWEIRRHRAAKAIKSSPNTSPGPDGIPFAAWRRPGPLGVDILTRVLQGFTTENGWSEMEQH